MNTKDKNKELMFNVDKMISDDESLIVYSQDGIDFTRIDMLVLGKIKFLYIAGYINSGKKYNYLINLYKEYVKLKRELEGFWYSDDALSDADFRIYNKKSAEFNRVEEKLADLELLPSEVGFNYLLSNHIIYDSIDMRGLYNGLELK